MRYFSYISATKVSMLNSQLPQNWNGSLHGKVEFNFGVLKGELGMKPPESRVLVEKLLKVEEYILSQEEIGSLSNPCSWISDTVDVAFWYAEHAANRDFNNRPLVVWVPQLSGSNYVALLGSTRHLLAYSNVNDPTIPIAPVGDYLSALYDPMSEEPTIRSKMRVKTSMLRQLRNFTCVSQAKISFLAKVLESWEDNGEHFVTASPLYVELVN